MKKDDDISKRIIQDGPGQKPFLKAVFVKLLVTAIVLVAASFLWMWYDAQACSLFYSAEADMNQGRYADAKIKGAKAASHMSLALMFNKIVLGESHAVIANDTLNLSRCYDVCAEYAKAEDLHRKACELFLKTKGESDYEYGWSLVSFGDHYRFRRNREKALEYYQKALPIIIKSRGTAGNDYTWTIQRIELAKKI